MMDADVWTEGHARLPKILVVDDEKVYLDVLVDLLQPHYQVVVARHGEQVFQRLEQHSLPALILLDVMMPDLDGFEVCRRLKAQAATAGIPVIFITGKQDSDDETMGLDVGAVDFIRKPFHHQVVLARIHTHLELQRQKNRLVELNQLKNRFLGMAAHDLRNPLTTVSGYCEMLLTMKLDEAEREHYTTRIQAVSQQMLKLINDLLDVATIESGRFDLHPQPYDLAELVQSRVQMITGQATKKGIAMVCELATTPAAHFDRDRLAQVIDNLLANAIKFTLPATTVTVTTGCRHHQVFCQVRDQGPGIPEAEQPRLFGAFQKLSPQPTAQERGTGLGLAIVKKIVDAHHGTITMANHPEGGAMFTVCLNRNMREIS